MTHWTEVDPHDAVDPLVLAVDIGSSASRASVYDAHGRPVGRRQKVAHAFTAAADGTSTIDPDRVVAEVEQLLDALASKKLAGRIAGVAIDTFASSLVGLDEDGERLTPCFTYADSRCAAEVAALRQEVDEVAVQQRTGTRIHASYLAPRLRWLARTQPDTFETVARWVSLGEYIHHRLLGVSAAGTSTAAWTGLLDRHTGEWDDRLLRLAGIDADRLGPVHDPGHTLEPATKHVSKRWPALEGARWFAPISDGYASNIGTGAADARTAVVSVATSGAMRVLVDGAPQRLPLGLWNYRVDADRSLLGGALNDVGRAVTWMTETLRLPDDPSALDAILREAPTAALPVVLPFFTGERSTGWAGAARATFDGVAATHGPQELFRAVMEGIALSYARLARELWGAAGDPDNVLASGRVYQDLPGVLALLAQALDLPVTPVTIKRSTLHGTALHALEVLAPGVARALPDTGPTEWPEPHVADYFRERLGAFETLYDGVRGD